MKDIILEKVNNALVKILKLPSNDFEVDTKLKELGLDSMSTLEFLIELEETVEGYSIDVDTLESEHLLTVATVVDYIIYCIESNNAN